MCQRVTCTTCGKPTWAGCGNHVEQALAGVPVAERCPRDHPEPPRQGLFAGLFGR